MLVDAAPGPPGAPGGVSSVASHTPDPTDKLFCRCCLRR